MVDSMKAGSVIVDLAAQNGGNCEYTVPGEIFTTENGVKVIGYTDLPGRLPTQSSQLYGTNLVNLLKLLCKEKDGNITVDFDDVVIRGVTVIRAGEITWPAPPIQVSAQPQAAQKAAPEVKTEEKCACSPWRKYALMALAIILFGWMASVAPKRVPWALHCVRAGLRCRLLRGVECIARAAYTVDVGHQRDFRDYCCRSTVADWRAAGLASLVLSRCL